MKKRLPLIIALIAAVSLFSITALAFSPDTTGYDAFKEALKSAKHFDNGTFNVQFEVTDNEQVIVDANVSGKADHATQNGSGQFVLQANGLTKTASFYKQGEKTILVDQDNDLYYQVNETADEDQSRRDRHYDQNEKFEATPAQEAFFDYLAGDLKNQIGLSENSDGTKTLTLDLNEEEIPVALNLMISAGASGNHHDREFNEDRDNHNEEFHDLPFFAGLEDMEQELPKLTEDVKVNNILVSLTLDAQNQVIAYDFAVTVEGSEATGAEHIVTLKSTGAFSDLNSTVVDTIDLTGKDVQVIDTEKEEN